jgi:hypothetical protein
VVGGWWWFECLNDRHSSVSALSFLLAAPRARALHRSPLRPDYPVALNLSDHLHSLSTPSAPQICPLCCTAHTQNPSLGVPVSRSARECFRSCLVMVVSSISPEERAVPSGQLQPILVPDLQSARRTIRNSGQGRQQFPRINTPFPHRSKVSDQTDHCVGGKG